MSDTSSTTRRTQPFYTHSSGERCGASAVCFSASAFAISGLRSVIPSLWASLPRLEHSCRPCSAGQLPAIASERSGQVTLLGVVVSLLAIAVSGVAGRRKEIELAGREAQDAASPGGHGEFRFGLGLLVAALAGTFSACFAYGLAAAKPINDSARIILLANGRSELWQSLPSLIIVLWGGWLTNALWCGGLLLRNRSADQFTRVPGYSGPRQLTLNYLFSAAAGLLWYGQFFFYSMGETRMGPYDFASWALHMAGTILFATLWGAVLHEWQGTSSRTKFVGAAGFAMLLLATIIIGYGSYLKVH